MGVRILSHYDTAVMYCSTSDWAFGPVFYSNDEHDAEERVESFIRWLKHDPREYDDHNLERKYAEWRTQEDAQWKAEEKESDE